MSREDAERWAHEYLVAFPVEPLEATRTLTTRIMGRIAEKLGASRLVDTTPANARKADRLEPIYPESTVVVVTRDGRDVAASFVSQPFGPDDVFEALDQWEQRMLRTHTAAVACRPGRVVTIELMDLVVNDRAGTLDRLCRAVGVPVDADMVEWFDANVTAGGAHPGRWRSDFDAETCARIDERYALAVERLTAQGVDIPR
jgi:hypothetical protein